MRNLNDLSGPFDPTVTFDCFSKEFLVKLAHIWQHAWLHLSECWYREVLKRYGPDVANACETGAWANMAERVNPRYAKLGKLELNTVVDSIKALQLPLDNTIGGLYPTEWEIINENHVIWTIPRCKSLEAFEAREPERIKHVCFINEKTMIERYLINKKIKVTPLKLPPRQSRDEIACKWEAVMMDTDQWGPYDSTSG